MIDQPLPCAVERLDVLLFEGLLRHELQSLDFVSDTFGDGRRFRILCIVDDFSRECLATVVDTSFSGVRVVRELEQLIRERGKPKIIVSDNGTELTSVAVLRWVPGRVTWHYIEPASRCRTLTLKASTADSGTNA